MKGLMRTAACLVFGLEPVGSMPQEFDAFIRAEIARRSKVVKTANLTAD